MEPFGILILVVILGVVALADKLGGFDGFRSDRYRCYGCRKHFTADEIDEHEKQCQAEQARRAVGH